MEARIESDEVIGGSMRSFKYLCGVLALSPAPSLALPTQVPTPASVVVLSTLHQFHEYAPEYDFGVLRQLLHKLKPDIVAVELTAEELKNRREQTVKREYQESVYPYLDSFSGSVIPLDPDEPLKSELAGLRRASEQALRDASPEKARVMGAFYSQFYQRVFSSWNSPCDVNSPETDALFEATHDLAFTFIYDSRWKEMWERWNTYSMNKIVESARRNPGKKIVVLMGFEHGYWMRKHLRQHREIELLPNCVFDDPVR